MARSALGSMSRWTYSWDLYLRSWHSLFAQLTSQAVVVFHEEWSRDCFNDERNDLKLTYITWTSLVSLQALQAYSWRCGLLAGWVWNGRCLRGLCCCVGPEVKVIDGIWPAALYSWAGLVFTHLVYLLVAQGILAC